MAYSIANTGSRRNRSSSSSSALFHLVVILASSARGSHIPDDPLVLKFTSPTQAIPSRLRSFRRNIPDKYDQDSDGVWRQADEYTLYGSTISPTCQPTTVTPLDTDELTQSLSTSTPTPTPDILDSLPLGWKPSTVNHKTRTAVIIALSLALALFICSLMAGCVVWRKNKLQFFKKKDEEMKLRRRRRPPPQDNTTLLHREVKANQRLWDRATAKWKANARYMAWQRRGKRITPKQPSVQNPPDPPPSASGLSSSTTHNITTRLRTRSPSVSSTSFLSTSPRPSTSSTPPNAALNNTPVHPSLPTYQRATRLPPPIHIPLQPVASSSILIATASGDDAPPYHTAHVATDDKTVLAQMANLASAPPPGCNADGQESAPIWHDEPDGVVEASSLPKHPPPPFLPPPSRQKMAAGPSYDNHTYFLEDLEYSEPAPGPSAPPFDEGCPGGPPPDVSPSAPLLDDANEDPGVRGGEPEELGTVHDHDPNNDPTQSDPLSTWGVNSSTSCAINHTLPCYHP